MDITKDPMTDKEEAKARMCESYEMHFNQLELSLALLRNDEVALSALRAKDARIKANNDKVMADLDAADAKELVRLVSTHKCYIDQPE